MSDTKQPNFIIQAGEYSLPITFEQAKKLANELRRYLRKPQGKKK